MPYSVWIKDRSTGETVRIEFENDFAGEGAHSEFWWSESDMACDCARYGEFMRAKGVDPVLSAPCAFDGFPDGRFQVVSIKLQDGTEVYSEVEVSESK